ncbi:GDP-mannose 4,6-dehydratase [Bacillus sp. AFS041924]|uniref:GDP-mannose 4,6-dehydratase n=1 Tax=Bacillus sp. AFS041924 TaxID=2033503 RepID=UPI000BFC87CA|nr:GDP-mannose 4,6-dehydratase [Bacillus sp. AFS041924]PGS49867.1 UDP-glucose 4-epimerase [Bacillus sp. AFS041924]
MKKVVVTGGAGFIGSNLVKAYLKNDYEVVVVDNLKTGKLDNIPPGVMFYEVDIRDPQFIEIILKEKPDVINHHAAQIDVQFSIQNPVEDASINILGTLNVLESLRKLKEQKDCRLVYASSAAAYGNPSYLGVDEKHSTLPISFYGASKLSPEFYVQIYHDLYDIPYSIFRYANVYGIGQDPKGEGGVISILVERIMNNSLFTIYGDGEQTRDFIFVDDIVHANLLASERSINDFCNISTHTPTTLHELLNIAEQVIDRKIETTYDKEKPGDIKHSFLTNDKAENLLNWKPSYSLFEGLKKTISYYEKMNNQ